MTEHTERTLLGAFVIGYVVAPLVLVVTQALDEALWVEILVAAAGFLVAYSIFLTWVDVRTYQMRKNDQRAG